MLTAGAEVGAAKWGSGVVSAWRTSRDTTYMPGYAYWSALMTIFNDNANLDMYAGPNAYNDPDFLVAGFKNISKVQMKSHVMLWAAMNAPLTIAADLAAIDVDTAALLKNRELISINQDPRNDQATVVANRSDTYTLARVQADGRVVICFFNNGQKPANFNIDIKSLPTYIDIDDAIAWNDAQSFVVTNVLTGGETVVSRQLIIEGLAIHDLEMFYIRMN